MSSSQLDRSWDAVRFLLALLLAVEEFLGASLGLRRRSSSELTPKARLRSWASVEDAWGSFTRRLRRLGFKRRSWAFLGHRLHEIKVAGQVTEDGYAKRLRPQGDSRSRGRQHPHRAPLQIGKDFFESMEVAGRQVDSILTSSTPARSGLGSSHMRPIRSLD